MRALIVAMIGIGTLAPAPAGAQTPACSAGVCEVRVTPDQLLEQAEALVRQHRYVEAAPLILALAQSPDMKLQSRFLTGFSASEQGHYAQAAATFKSILADDPGQTRVRLELARAMLGLGQAASADRQFRIAEQSGELPPDVAAAIRGARQVIRTRRAWRFDVDLGFAPDSNINNATAADRINVFLGDTTLPIELDGNARAKSGTGQTGTIAAGVRLPVSGGTTLLLGVDGNATNYKGSAFDDFLVQGAAGAERQLSDTASVSVEGVAANRWYGGDVASRQVGVRTGVQLGLGPSARLGVQLDTRRTTALFDSNYSGWQAGLYATAEKAVARTLVASFGGFARRDWLTAAAYSNTELGVTAGLGGELPLGITFGVAGNLSRAVYDAATPIFSPDPRHDWRYGGRLTVGNRALSAFGFSPQVTLSYNRTASDIAFWTNDRLRLRFSVARYF